MHLLRVLFLLWEPGDSVPLDYHNKASDGIVHSTLRFPDRHHVSNQLNLNVAMFASLLRPPPTQQLSKTSFRYANHH